MSDLISVDFQAIGLSELDEQLEALTNKAKRKALESALMKASHPIMKEAKKNAPKDEGDLKKAIGRQRIKKSELPSVAVAVKKSRNKPYPFYWYFIEHGTSKFAAAPYLRPAFENNAELAVQIFADELRVQIDKLTQS